MGFDLVSSKNDISANIAGWQLVLQTALDNGWKPRGITKCSRPNSEDEETYETTSWICAKNNINDYFVNDGQIVEKKDALAIAKALKKAVAKLDPSDYSQKEYIDWFNRFIEFFDDEFIIW